MELSWFPIDYKIDEKIKREMLLLAESVPDSYYYDHYSTGKNEYSNVNLFLDPEKELYNISKPLLDDFRKKPDKFTFLKIEPNKTVKWHVDNPKFKRNTVIVFPLSDNFASCEMESGEITFGIDCYAFDPNIRHRVVNNNKIRVSLQLIYDTSLNEMRNIYNRNELFN